MRTYPLIIRMADGSETTQVFEDYQGPHPITDQGADDARISAMSNPQVREIEVRRIKNGDDQQMELWTRDPANGNWISAE